MVSITSKTSSAVLILLDCRGPIKCNSIFLYFFFKGNHLLEASCTLFSPKIKCPSVIKGSIFSEGNVLETAIRFVFTLLFFFSTSIFAFICL